MQDTTGINLTLSETVCIDEYMSKREKEKRFQEWDEVEELILQYQLQFQRGATYKEKRTSDRAAEQLIEKFAPLFKKYLTLIKTGNINFQDKEQKRFVLSFIGDANLKHSLKQNNQNYHTKILITERFNFVKETYGALDEQDINIDLQMLFFVLAKRYKQVGRNFCAYLYNAYCYEVSRHIKKFTKDPANIPYRSTEFEEYMTCYSEATIETCFEDKIYENNMGIPDFSWVLGMSCSEVFSALSILERKLLLKYYLEDYNDRQIAEEFSMHINTVNQKRRKAIRRLATLLEIDESEIRRNRKSGKKALLYHTLKK